MRAPNTPLGIAHKVCEIQNLPLNVINEKIENLNIKVMVDTGKIA